MMANKSETAVQALHDLIIPVNVNVCTCACHPSLSMLCTVVSLSSVIFWVQSREMGSMDVPLMAATLALLMTSRNKYGSTTEF